MALQAGRRLPEIECNLQGLERAMGIEPTYAAWEAAVLPLNYARDRRLCSTARIALKSDQQRKKKVRNAVSTATRTLGRSASRLFGEQVPDLFQIDF